MIVPTGIALGSNLGNRVAELEAGIGFLTTLSTGGLIEASDFMETAPVDCPEGSRPFLNAVAEIQVDSDIFTPRMILERLRAFETDRGRSASDLHHAPRPLDLDLLYFGDEQLNEADLVIPHPRLWKRRFVLEPLRQIRPDLVLPGQSQSVRELLAALR